MTNDTEKKHENRKTTRRAAIVTPGLLALSYTAGRLSNILPKQWEAEATLRNPNTSKAEKVEAKTMVARCEQQALNAELEGVTGGSGGVAAATIAFPDSPAAPTSKEKISQVPITTIERPVEEPSNLNNYYEYLFENPSEKRILTPLSEWYYVRNTPLPAQLTPEKARNTLVEQAEKYPLVGHRQYRGKIQVIVAEESGRCFEFTFKMSAGKTAAEFEKLAICWHDHHVMLGMPFLKDMNVKIIDPPGRNFAR